MSGTRSLPVKSNPGSDDKKFRRGFYRSRNNFACTKHVTFVNNEMTMSHDNIQENLVTFLDRHQLITIPIILQMTN